MAEILSNISVNGGNCPRCETAISEHEAGRCLDAWVEKVVMGLDGPAWHYGVAKKYSTEIAEAWSVIENVELNARIHINQAHPISINSPNGSMSVFFDPADPFEEGWVVYQGIGDTTSLAICRAALEATYRRMDLESSQKEEVHV